MNRTAFFLREFILMAILTAALTAQTVIEPAGSSDDAGLIQTALDGLADGDTLLLKGDFILGTTIYLPSNFAWKLDGTLTLAGNAVFDEIGYIDTSRNIDATRPTAITEKPEGASHIDMSGGTYHGNSANSTQNIRFINFVYITLSSFHDMTITDASDDNFTLGPGCHDNECRNLIGSFSRGNALNDKGDNNKWFDCIAEDCESDGWTPKCRNSEFHRCIGRRNGGPGFGMFVRIDGSGNPDLGERIEGNKFYDCESYDNSRGGFSFDISSTSGEGGIVRNNYIEGIAYNNRMQGVIFRNKQPNSIIENNEVNIVAWGNLGQRSDGTPSIFAGGLGVEGSATSPIRGITGTVICYNNISWDVNTNQATDCNIIICHPTGENAPVLNDSSTSNTLTVIDFDCSDSLLYWCQQKYCDIIDSTPPAGPASPEANAFSKPVFTTAGAYLYSMCGRGVSPANRNYNSLIGIYLTGNGCKGIKKVMVSR